MITAKRSFTDGVHTGKMRTSTGKLRAYVRRLGRLVVARPYTHLAFRDARAWSNLELQRYAPLFTGSVVNVSAWKQDRHVGL